MEEITEIKISGRKYELIRVLKAGESSIEGAMLIQRAVEVGASSGKDDGMYILRHKDELPEILRGNTVFIFTNWQKPDDENTLYTIFPFDGIWIPWFSYIESTFGKKCTFLRRKR